MNTLVAFVLGVLVGLAIYWFIYRLYWHRWRGYLVRDMTYLKEKVKAADDLKFALERQLNAEKSEQGGLRQKIAALERENVRIMQQLEEAGADKNALVSHLDTLRQELDGYQKSLAFPTILPLGEQVLAAHPAASQPQATPHSNGKTHQPISAVLDAGFSGPSTPLNGHGAIKTDRCLPVSDPLQPLIPASGKEKFFLPASQVLEPVLHIARPWLGGDRLEIIPGLSPMLVKKLHQAGIASFPALSVLTPDRLKEVLGPRAAKKIDPAAVIAQAKRLAEERKREK